MMIANVTADLLFRFRNAESVTETKQAITLEIICYKIPFVLLVCSFIILIIIKRRFYNETTLLHG